MQVNSSMLSTFAYQALVSVSVLFDYATSKPAIQEPWIQTSWNHAFLGKNAVIWNGQTFSHVLVWSFIAVLYCHMFSSTGTDLVDFRPWLSQQHCLQSWFRPGSIVQSGPPRPNTRGVQTVVPVCWWLHQVLEKTLWWRNSVNCCCVRRGEVTFTQVPPYHFTDLYTGTAWVGIPVSVLRKSCTQIRAYFILPGSFF